MKTDEELFGALKEATEGLLYMSESDYPVEVIRWDSSEQLSPDYLRKVAGVDSSAAVEESTLEELFRVPSGEQEWKDEAQLTEARRYQHLRRLLEDTLTDIKVYRMGEVNVFLLVVGMSAESNWIGVSTRAIET